MQDVYLIYYRREVVGIYFDKQLALEATAALDRDPTLEFLPVCVPSKIKDGRIIYF